MARSAVATKPKFDLPIVENKFETALAPERSTPVSLPQGLEPGELVVAINNGQRPLTVEHASKKYVLIPDKPVRMPFEAACLWFGDPRTGPAARSIRHESGLIDWVADRATEIRRLRIKYGLDFGDERGFLDSEGTSRVPNITVETMDGNKIPTVLEYPDGIPTMVQPGMTELETLKVQLLRNQNMTNRLVEILESQGIDLKTAGVDAEGGDGGDEELAVDSDE